ncbi:hypothetical protein Aperf_G00000036489 [Anoplocephala perfoliata]
MRKKSVATKLIMHPDLNLADSVPTEIRANTANTNEEQSNDPIIFSTDATGNVILPDGTPVVQPAGVEDTTDRSLQFDLQDGTLPRKPFTSTFQFGSIDTVRCTSCAVRISPFACAVHPHLSVILCKKCLKFYGKGEFAKDADGKDENCRWCGDGGDLICCDSCSNTFCKSCIKRNLGRTFLQNIENLNDDDSWNCLICNSSVLVPLQQECMEVFERVKSLNEQARKRAVIKRSRPTSQVTPKITGKSSVHTIGKSSQDVPIATVVNPEFPAPQVTVSSKNIFSPVTCNSVEFYLKNSSVADVLTQISSIRSETFSEVVRSLRFCIDAFSNDIRRVEASFVKAKTKEEEQIALRSFQSIFRYHFFNRIANLVSRVNEKFVIQSTPNPSSTKPSTVPETIDLTEDSESVEAGTNGQDGQSGVSTSGTHPVKRKRGVSVSSTPSNGSVQKKRRKTLLAPANKNIDLALPPPASNEAVEKLVSDAVAAAIAVSAGNEVEAKASSVSDLTKENTQIQEAAGSESKDAAN